MELRELTAFPSSPSVATRTFDKDTFVTSESVATRTFDCNTNKLIGIQMLSVPSHKGH